MLGLAISGTKATTALKLLVLPWRVWVPNLRIILCGVTIRNLARVLLKLRIRLVRALRLQSLL